MFVYIIQMWIQIHKLKFKSSGKNMCKIQILLKLMFKNTVLYYFEQVNEWMNESFQDTSNMMSE